MKTLKKPLSLLMALFMCLGMFAGTGVTAFAAGETMTTYMVDIPRANDPNKAGWGHPALNFLGGWSTSAGTHFSVHTQDAYNGRAIYCIEPGIGVHSGDQYTGRGEDFWDNYPSSLNPTIPPNTIKEYIGRIMTYGWQGNASTSWMSSNPDHANQMAGYIATQLLVWETIVGERDSQFNHVDANAQGKNNVTEYISAEHPLRSQIFSQYSAIESAVKRHTMLPSFFSSTADAGAYELKWDGEKYSATLTDTNGVLGDYTFSSSTAGLNFSVDGSQLTITSSQALKGSVTVKAEKISAQRSGVVVWTDGVTGGGTQDFATYGTTVSDQMVGYLNLEVKTGNMKLIKTSEDGKVEGISFTITGEGYNATKTTNAAGEIDITDLNPGVYTVTEQSIDKYEPQATQRVTIVSGQTATVTFNNVLKRGSLEVTKTSEDGLAEGMTFHLSGTSLSGLPVDEYAVTDSTGVARFENVLIGTGYVLEEVDTPIRYVVPEAQTATIEWNEVTDKTVNNILKKFRVTVTKSDVETGTPQGDGSLAGATYGLYKGDTLIDSFTTDENGQFTTGYYVCDSDWTIREINPSEGYLVDSTIHHVGAEPELYTIELNDTANDVTEQIIKGDIAIIKHTDDGETGIETPEEGAEFQIYLKAAGSYDAAKDSERDVLVCDENGFAQSKKLPYGTYIVHQTKGWEGRELMDDFEVYISQDGQTYRYLINNAAFESYIKVVKVDAETGVTIPYAGAGFQIYRPDGSKVEMTFTYPTPTTIDTFYTNAEGYPSSGKNQQPSARAFWCVRFYFVGKCGFLVFPGGTSLPCCRGPPSVWTSSRNSDETEVHSVDAGKKRIWVRGQLIEVTDEVYAAYMKGDRKMRYFEKDLKCERLIYGSNGEIKQVIPSREDSLDRLMEENARQFAANAESVEDVVFRKLTLDKLHTALLQLPKEERALIYALFFDGKTESEVAKHLGVSRQAIQKRKNRILKKLKKFFE